MNKEEKKQYDSKYYGEHKEKIDGANKAWRLSHPEKMREYTRKWYKKVSSDVFVYRWISPKGYTAYVGRGTKRRVNQHIHSSWFEPDMFVRALKARNEWHAIKLEGLWGELFQPRFNKDGNRK